MALTGQALQDKLLKDATRLFAFSSLCPREDNPYRFKALLMVEALNANASEILTKNPKNRFLNDFIPSISEQFKQKGYLSNRQVEIVENILIEAGLDVEAILAAAKVETDDAFIELQKKYPSEIENFKAKAEREYNAYCEQMRAQAARRYHRGGSNRSYCYR